MMISSCSLMELNKILPPHDYKSFLRGLKQFIKFPLLQNNFLFKVYINYINIVSEYVNNVCWSMIIIVFGNHFFFLLCTVSHGILYQYWFRKRVYCILYLEIALSRDVRSALGRQKREAEFIALTIVLQNMGS